MFTRLKRPFLAIKTFYTKRSTLAFFGTLGLLLALIVVSDFLRTPEPETAKLERPAKKTALYSESVPLYMEAVSTVKKEGVTSLVALTPGIVTNILVKPGQAVGPGTTLLTLTNDYNGGSANLAEAIAKNNVTLTEELNRLDKNIEDDQQRIAKNDDLLTKRQERVALSALKKARATRNVNLTNAQLNYQLAAVNDAALKPTALTSGFVQSVRVRKGDYVSPGSVLATLSNPAGMTVLDAFVTSEVASFVDITKAARITLSDKTEIHLVPTYFSASEDQDGMFMIQFILPDDRASKISINENPTVALPLRFSNAGSTLVPLDAVFKNSDSAVVLVAVNNKAESRSVSLGRVRGNYVEVLSGLEKSDHIILNRFVLAGDTIEVVPR